MWCVCSQMARVRFGDYDELREVGEHETQELEALVGITGLPVVYTYHLGFFLLFRTLDSVYWGAP